MSLLCFWDEKYENTIYSLSINIPADRDRLFLKAVNDQKLH